MKRIVLLPVILFGYACVAQAQGDVQFAHYNMALGYYNPASAGRSGDLDITALYRMQWAGWSNAPKSLFATANMPFRFLKKEHGVGVVVVSDNTSSLYNDMSAGLQYAYLKKMGKGTLRVGVQFGMVSITGGGDHVITPDSMGGHDPAIPASKVESKVFDANFGLYYATDKWYVGAAVMHVLEPEIDEENFYTYISRGYNFTGGCNIRLNNSLIELQPSVFVQTKFNTYKADVTARAVYAKKYSAGLSWRMDENRIADAFVLMLGATFGKIEGGYAYDKPFSNVGRGTAGSHELFLKYRMQLNKPKTGKSRHKSVRLL
ncbi:MAG: PorP/SprF family type IX secretion system membrane protein [Tannerella sp.]|jgi:type IX secretion system PorP/SprF family membrane protein|nr:PorP/SprF family type IX secretion system membrane protein [Tannerella sp.]